MDGLKQAIIFGMLLFLTGCVQTEVNDSSHITEIEVVEALQNYNIELNEGTSLEDTIFISKLV